MLLREGEVRRWWVLMRGEREEFDKGSTSAEDEFQIMEGESVGRNSCHITPHHESFSCSEFLVVGKG